MAFFRALRFRSGIACLGVVAGCAIPTLTASADPPYFPGIPATLTVDVTTVDSSRHLIGAKHDGVTDDTAAIQAAINYVGSQGGGTVYFPAGTYLVNTIPTSPGNGAVGSNNQLWMQNNIRLLGTGGRTSVLKMPAGDPENPADQAARENRAIVAIGNRNYSAQQPNLWQQNIEIASLGFDLDDGTGRNAIQMFDPVINVRIHDCEGFQSGLEKPNVLLEARNFHHDNHFFDMDAVGFPIDQGLQPNWVDIPENITVDHCTIKDLMQLTSDGGAGCRNLWIHDNIVDNALSYGIAITSTGPENVLFEDILIENNTIESPVGAGIFIGENSVTTAVPFAGLTLHAMRGVTIRNNTINVRSEPVDGLMLDPNPPNGSPAAYAPYAEGMILGNALLETRSFTVQGNVLTCTNLSGIGTSRQAFKIGTWDFNWSQTWQQNHAGSLPIIGPAGFGADGHTLTLAGHGLITGLQVQFKSLSAVALPSGLAPYTDYGVAAIDSNRFSLVDLSTGNMVKFGTPPAGGSYQLIVAPSQENFVVTANKVRGSWDWDASVSGVTKNFTVTSNNFCSRFDLTGAHDSLYFSGNFSTGTLGMTDCTLNQAVFSTNSWSSSPATVGYQPGIVFITGPSDQWRRVTGFFVNNTFSFAPAPTAPKIIVPAFWMNLGIWGNGTWPAWAGAGALQFFSNHFVTAANLDWRLAPGFVSGWDGNDGKNDSGTITPSHPPTSGWALRDFDGNASADIVLTNPSSGDFGVWTLNGTAPLTFALSGNKPPPWSIVGAADFNHDGRADLLWHNPATGEVSVMLMNGTVPSGSVSLGIVPLSWTVAGLGDFNNDGQTDILWHDNAAGTNGYWLLNGTTVTGFTTIGSLPSPWTIVGVGDFNRDGTSELLCYNPVTGGLLISMLNGFTVANSQAIGLVPASWTVAGVADFDRDGCPDLLLRSPATGGFGIWLMNRTTPACLIPMGGLPASWQPVD